MDEAVAATDRHALQRTDRKRLLRVLNDLRSEVCAEIYDRQTDDEGVVQGQPLGALSEEDEQLVASLREGLESLAGRRQEHLLASLLPSRVRSTVRSSSSAATF